MAKHRKIASTIKVRRMIYDSTVKRSTLWFVMTVEQLKAEYLKLGNTPSLCIDNRDDCIRYLFLAQMKRMIGGN